MTAREQPGDLAWVERHWKTMLAIVGLFGAAGYTVLSPGQKVDALRDEFRAGRAAQVVTDSVQSVRLDKLEVRTDVELRELRREINLMMLSQCVRTSDQQLRVLMECRRRMDGEGPR